MQIYSTSKHSCLKGLAQAKIISIAHLPVSIDIETKFPYFLFLTWLSKIRNQEFCLYLVLLVKAQHKKIKKIAVLVYGHVYIIWSYE